MKRGLHRRTSVWREKIMFCFLSAVFSIAAATSETSHSHSTLGVSAPHLYYTCPEGATVKLLCAVKGATLYPGDALGRRWFFTPHSDRHCTGVDGPRKIKVNQLHANHTLPPGLQFGYTEQKLWVELRNVTRDDQGRYCCVVFDFKKEHHHASLVQKSHSHIVLQITPRRDGPQNCTVWDPTPTGGTMPVVLAIAACILALLSLPLILVLVYKQRQNAHSSRRAQELVRMDSEAHGHENPVFLGESPQIKTRTVSQIMTRQSSETGRHLLSEPGTPLSPPTHGDVFFPIEDTIPESPDFLQV